MPIWIVLLGFLLPRLPSSPMLREAFWAVKVNDTKLYDIVFVGDSRIYRGVDTKFLSQMNMSAFNFGFSSASPDSLLITHALKKLNPKGLKIIVIGVSANSFMTSSINNTHFKSVQAWSNKDKWIKTNIYPKLNFFDHHALSDIYKFYKGEAYYENYDLMTGYAASDRYPFDSSSALSPYKQQFENESYSYSAETAFKSKVLQLKSLGYEPILVRMPCAQSMINLEDSATNNSVKKLLTSISNQGVLVMPTFNSSDFLSYDGSHLSSQSARHFTELFMQYLKDSTSILDERNK
ncbi:MAG: hypothetical protein IT245_02505 [Bacteroidia bacterium]|nr:hypothetical protein [Bacteroidia bacterium]